MSNFLTVLLIDVLRNPIKSLWRSVFAKIVNDFKPFNIFAKKLHHRYLTVERFYEKGENWPQRLFHFFIVISADVAFLQ